MAQYLLLQGTLEQTTYASMVAWHASTYLRLQDHRPNLQRRLMQTAYLFMTVTKAVTFPQKFAPAGFALYWLTRSECIDYVYASGFGLQVRILTVWHDIEGASWGRAWIVWCTFVLLLLLIIQVKFADDAFPLAAQ